MLVAVLGRELDDALDHLGAVGRVGREHVGAIELGQELADDIRQVLLGDHADEEVQGAVADRHVVVVDALEDDVVVLRHDLGVHREELGQGEEAEVLDCRISFAC